MNIIHSLGKYVLALMCIAAVSAAAHAQTRFIKGIVIDSLSRESIPYTALFVNGTGGGVLADGDGRFTLAVPSTPDTLRVSVMGYSIKKIPTSSLGKGNVTVELIPTGVQLSEVIVKPKKEKYSKKNNPAVDLLNRIRNSRDINDPYRHDYYNYDKYERISVAVNDFDPDGNYSWFGDKFKFLKNYVDTSEMTGRPILNFMVKEKKSDVNYSRSAGRERETVTAARQDGLENLQGDKEASRKMLEDVFREVDIYSNDITLLQNRFVSPLSRIAADFYKYYISDTVVIEGDSCIELSFVPHTPETFGFIGKLFVVKDDPGLMVKRVIMHMPHTINVNFLDAITIRQDYAKADDGTRLKTSDDMTVELSLMPGLPKMYARRRTAYDGFNFDKPTDMTVFSYDQPVRVMDDADTYDDDFWSASRTVPLDSGEARVNDMMNDLHKVPLYYWTERTVKLIADGYIPTGKPSKFDIGPITSFLSFNTVSGMRLRAGGMTTAALSPRWFGRGYAAYGIKSHKWEYSAELEYSFNDKKYHPREFPIHSLRLISLYELDQLGQKYTAAMNDNFFMSWKRMEDTRVTYRRAQQLEYNIEFNNNFSVRAAAVYERQESTPWIPFVNGYGQSFSHYNEAMFELNLRYAPGEKFIQRRNDRIRLNFDAPIMELSHVYAHKGFLGSKYDINRTEFRVFYRLWLSAFGYINIVAKGGHSWAASPYMNLLLPNANITYITQPESFALMNPLEFVNDTYGLLDIKYRLNGLILNRIPLIKKLKLREVAAFRALWGHLSKRNNPAYNPYLIAFPTDVHPTLMNGTPYMEASVGVENILSIFSIESVWRLSYRHNPEAPDWGIRVGFHVAF